MENLNSWSLLSPDQNVLRGIGKAYVENLNSPPPPSPHGSNWGHKIADFEFLSYISFNVAFID